MTMWTMTKWDGNQVMNKVESLPQGPWGRGCASIRSENYGVSVHFSNWSTVYGGKIPEYA